MTNAISLARPAGTPSPRARSSSSRIAKSWRPRTDRRSAHDTAAAKTTIPRLT
jgi:hypothetical protein